MTRGEVERMRHFLRFMLVLAAAGLAGCTITQAPSTPQPKRSTAATLGVPPGQLPPIGQCRIWIPGRPAGRQARARSCDGIVAAAPAGAWILYRPGENRRIVRVRYVDETRAGIVVLIRLFEAATGEFLSEEDPEKPGRRRGRRKGKGN